MKAGREDEPFLLLCVCVCACVCVMEGVGVGETSTEIVERRAERQCVREKESAKKERD